LVIIFLLLAMILEISIIETVKEQVFTLAVMPIAVTGAIVHGRARQGKPCFA
jgi:hypothetical protein